MPCTQFKTHKPSSFQVQIQMQIHQYCSTTVRGRILPVYIRYSHRTYLGFQWPYQGKPTYFVFYVLPFRMSTRPFVFTKVLKPAINYWRSAGRRICIFLVDGLGGNSCMKSACTNAIAVRADLAKLGFRLSVDCVWEPSFIQTSLVHVLNMSENHQKITRVSNLRESISSILTNPNKVRARSLPEVTGRIISMHKAIGSTVYLYTRQMDLAIETRASWDSFISCSPRVINELQFWHNRDIWYQAFQQKPQTANG